MSPASATGQLDRRTARYQEILDVLRERIGTGAYPVGTTMPSEAEFCREFEASRFTIREALRRLQAEGLVTRKQGAGSTVIRQRATGLFVQSYGSIDQLLQFARDTDYRLIEMVEERLDDPLSARLGGEEGETWICQRGLRLSRDSDEPLALIESYLPPDHARLAAAIATRKPPFYQFLEEQTGERVTDMVQEVQAHLMPPRVAQILHLPPGTPALRILRRYETASGTLIASFNWHPGGDRFIYRTRLKQTGAEPG